LHRNYGPFAIPFGLFQTCFRAKICVNEIQTADYQSLEKIVKIAYLRPIGLLVANVASREVENE